MNVHDFARRHLEPYTTKGNEIIPQYCPYCHGGAHRDKYTFALNIDRQVFKCQRGSCGKQGHFSELCKDFGEQMDRDTTFEPFRKEKRYVMPNQGSRPLTNKAVEYMALRKISKQTLDRCNVGADDNGNIRFNFKDETGEIIFTKYRPAHKVDKSKGERKAWRDSDTKPILYLMNLCTFDKPLIITEGEIDALSLIECGIGNAVSVPSGTQDLTFLDTCFDWLNKFSSITLFLDSDQPGREMTSKLAGRLGEYRVNLIPLDMYRNCKDANELLYRYGKEAVIEAAASGKPVPVAGLLELADVKYLDITQMERVSSGIKHIDSMLGGFLMGQLTVWTGKRGEGKSTMLGQIMLEAVENDYKVCVYSGELQATYFQYCIDLQAAGLDNIQQRYDELRGKDISTVSGEIREQIHNWYRGKFYIYDNSIAQSSETKNILKVFEYAVKRYDCKVFMVDNLMTARYSANNDSDFYRKQSAFCGELVEFAKKYNVHIHLVAHPRKTSSNLDNDDIAGSGDISNRADNVITIKRLPEHEVVSNGFTSMLKVLKNRFSGECGEVGLNFCPISRRFYLPSGGNTKYYGWAVDEHGFVTISNTDDLPF